MFVWVYTCFGLIVEALLEYAATLFVMRNTNVKMASDTKLTGFSETTRKHTQIDSKQATMEKMSKKADFYTAVFLFISFSLFNIWYWSKNLTMLHGPFPEENPYLDDATYDLTLRIHGESYMEKPMTGAEVKWCTDCNYPYITYHLLTGKKDQNVVTTTPSTCKIVKPTLMKEETNVQRDGKCCGMWMLDSCTKGASKWTTVKMSYGDTNFDFCDLGKGNEW